MEELDLMEYEYFCFCVIGIDDFWTNTVRKNAMLVNRFNKRREYELYKIRDIEFALYNTSFRGMKGEKSFKNVKSPMDLYKLPGDDKIKNEKSLSGKAAEDYIKSKGFAKRK